MVSASLIDTEVDIDPGGATVDVAEVHKEGDLRIVEDGNRHRVNKDGLYDFNAVMHLIRVFDGQAVIDDGARVKVNGGHEVDLDSARPIRHNTFDKEITRTYFVGRACALHTSRKPTRMLLGRMRVVRRWVVLGSVV
jgi:hypothetical protein